MKTLNFTDTHELVILEEGDKQRHLENPEQFWNETKNSVLLSEITEDQARETATNIKDYIIAGYPHEGYWIERLKIHIKETLKENGLELRKGEKPEKLPDFYSGKARVMRIGDQATWDAAIPLNRILIVEK